MSRHLTPFTLRRACSNADVAAAQALRYRVFVEELGGVGGELTDSVARLEADRFDAFCDHLLLIDTLRDGMVVGTTRVMTDAAANRAGRFASSEEFDLSKLLGSGRRLLEVGRTCLHPDYRGGAAMHRLWHGVAALVEERGVEIMFGLASFSGTESEAVAPALSCLHHDFLAPEELRPRSLEAGIVNILPPDKVDRRKAMQATPALVKAYLRLGGRVGEGTYLDRSFGCLDVCMVVDTAMLSDRARSIYGGERR